MLSLFCCIPGKLKRLSQELCGDGLGGGVALTLEGLLCWKCAGEEGVEEVADDGLLLDSSWLILGTGSSKHTRSPLFQLFHIIYFLHTDLNNLLHFSIEE